MRLSVLMTVYNEAEYIGYAIDSCLQYVDDLVIVEGAYEESIRCGAAPRSTDGTCESAKFRSTNTNECLKREKVFYIEANELSDPQQRNVGLKKIKEINPNGWLLIVDGDEVYEPSTFSLIRSACQKMEKNGQHAAYFTSQTFVNDFKHYTPQEFPRLFKITNDCEFVNDNFMVWKDKFLGWSPPHVIKLPQIKYFHYAFCKKDRNRFELKKKWWETRFGRSFDYGWSMNKEGKISDPNHKIYEFTGKHPEIMRGHRLYDER